jgi:hypothetical protein
VDQTYDSPSQKLIRYNDGISILRCTFKRVRCSGGEGFITAIANISIRDSVFDDLEGDSGSETTIFTANYGITSLLFIACTISNAKNYVWLKAQGSGDVLLLGNKLKNVQCDAANSHLINVRGVRSFSMTNCELVHCRARAGLNCLVDGNNGQMPEFHHCSFTSVNYTKFLFYFEGTAFAPSIRNCEFINTTLLLLSSYAIEYLIQCRFVGTAPSAIGILDTKGTHLHLTQCTFENFATAISATGSVGARLKICSASFTDCAMSVFSDWLLVTLENCQFYGGTETIVNLVANQVEIRISGCLFEAPTGLMKAALAVSNVCMLRITNTRFAVMAQAILFSADSGTGVSFDNVCFSSNKVAALGTRPPPITETGVVLYGLNTCGTDAQFQGDGQCSGEGGLSPPPTPGRTFRPAGVTDPPTRSEVPTDPPRPDSPSPPAKKPSTPPFSLSRTLSATGKLAQTRAFTPTPAFASTPPFGQSKPFPTTRSFSQSKSFPTTRLLPGSASLPLSAGFTRSKKFVAASHFLHRAILRHYRVLLLLKDSLRT